ncbi:hypothetical protein GCM10010211_66940 [Streptomyces albospinus]|uniref:Uncharacterized protein n=1 Tax=Streptomyces albospinus TaxID=285515 RepID=A0ABQ2VJU8_9ACTN|nr:hypothetical protein [Streptomyces albospinus]GGU90936.1 hypothetical protein GCM10010211_66940 [Streptomyces albospinus]
MTTAFGPMDLAGLPLADRIVMAPMTLPDRSSSYGGDDTGYVDHPALAD